MGVCMGAQGVCNTTASIATIACIWSIASMAVIASLACIVVIRMHLCPSHPWQSIASMAVIASIACIVVIRIPSVAILAQGVFRMPSSKETKDAWRLCRVFLRRQTGLDLLRGVAGRDNIELMVRRATRKAIALSDEPEKAELLQSGRLEWCTGPLAQQLLDGTDDAEFDRRMARRSGAQPGPAPAAADAHDDGPGPAGPPEPPAPAVLPETSAGKLASRASEKYLSRHKEFYRRKAEMFALHWMLRDAVLDYIHEIIHAPAAKTLYVWVDWAAHGEQPFLATFSQNEGSGRVAGTLGGAEHR